MHYGKVVCKMYVDSIPKSSMQSSLPFFGFLLFCYLYIMSHYFLMLYIKKAKSIITPASSEHYNHIKWDGVCCNNWFSAQS